MFNDDDSLSFAIALQLRLEDDVIIEGIIDSCEIFGAVFESAESSRVSRKTYESYEPA